MYIGKATDIPPGGFCAFQLPRDPSCASQARSLLAATMRDLTFPIDSVEDAKLAVSELATNAHTHATSMSRPELWVWARTCPAPELVVSVFDTHREIWPVSRDTDLLDEHGKGLSIVAALSSEMGTHHTRSRLTTSRGKCVWFTLPLPTGWPVATHVITPAMAASRLSEVLRARGIPATCRGDDSGAPVISVGALNIWMEANVFSWRTSRGHVSQPLIDLQEVAERIVNCHETAGVSASPA
ncbi:ATP-binding protein [Actinomadura sp. 6K520]|uniref:ATP-binding protein n=1 Tax=Actinomadura sp. 6K520 TaxID=2530364 RepID=UPI0010510F8C|nr:ATP-binding protein [Actinomadura sp. 6K520]TDE29993.1 ATP-binding protein [Actinomadura sp. 6K520]